MNFSINPYSPGGGMMSFGTTDAMAEEERKRREKEAALAAQAQAQAQDVESGLSQVGPVAPTPIKETRTIDPATGEVKLSITGNERDLTAANANTPTYSGAKPADNTFDRMIQAESGGRQTDAQGRVLTSNKGALGIAQVMPTTAMQPGYGVMNIFDLAQKRGIPFQNRDRATAEQLLGNQNLNREFGQNYYNAMNTKFDGGPGAVAAYNAGPGRVSQNMAQNQGQLNVGQLPQETQGYLQKVGMPAQGQRPPQPVSPEQVAQQPQQPGPMAANEGIRIPGLTSMAQMGQQAQDKTTAGIQRFQSNQDNLDELVKMRNDTSVPEHIRKRSGERAYELMSQQYNKEKGDNNAKTMIENGDQLAVAKAISSKPRDEEGSWLKLALLGFISPQLAGQEAIKLGLGPTSWSQSSYTDKDGNQIGVEVKTRSDGKILGGTRFDGTPLTTDELNLVSTSSPLGKGTSLSAEVYVDPTTGSRYRSGFDASGKAAMVNIQGGAAYRGDPKNLTIQSIGTAAQKAENAAAVKLRYAGPTSYTEAGAAAAGKFNFENGTNIGYASQQPGAPLIDLNTGKPVSVGAGGVITTTQTGTPNAPTTTSAPAAGGLTPGDITRQGKMKEAEGQQFVKYGADDITPKAEAGSQISRIRKEQLYGPDGILNNAELAGVLQGQGSASAEVANIFRDIITGGFKDQADLSQRINALGLSQRQKDVVSRQVGLMLSVNPLTLRANAGPGAVSDAEQKANREANVDILRQPLYSGLSLLTRDQFNKDLNVARAEFKAARPDIQTTEQFNSVWSSEKAKKEKEFDQIYAERAKYISKYNSDGKNPGAIIDAYKHYPVPVFDAQSKAWDYGTEFSKKAARPKLNDFNK